MAAELPPDILAEIFSRLPVKSLLRFRSTSKSLRSLIDSHKFINLHLQNSNNRSLILQRKFDLYQFQIDDDDDDDFSKWRIPLNHPFTGNTTTIDPFEPFEVNNTMTRIGSCNGLLAISKGKFAFINPHDVNEIAIWNPNTRKHRIIPFLPLPIPILDPTIKASLCVHGFGFDSLCDDYKLLRISYLIDHQSTFYDPHVRLFSSNTNSWKIIPTMPYVLQYYHTMGVFVDNSSSIHWVAKRKSQSFQSDLILAFNLALETFNEAPLPDELGEEVNRNSFEIRVAVLGGCLCMTVDYKTTTKVDIWVMKEYGSRDSWCKLFTLVKSSLDLPLDSLRPLCYSSDGSKVLLEGDHVLLQVQHWKLFWYDLKSEQVSYVEGISDLDDAMVCVGSLVPPPPYLVDNCTKENLPVDNGRKKENHTSKRRDDFLSRGFKLRL